jgi:phytoene/squalene synthetase
MTFQSERARAYLQDGLGLLPRSTGEALSASRRSRGIYRETLERIEERGFDVFDGPPHLSTLTKLRIVGEGLRR